MNNAIARPAPGMTTAGITTTGMMMAALLMWSAPGAARAATFDFQAEGGDAIAFLQAPTAPVAPAAPAAPDTLENRIEKRIEDRIEGRLDRLQNNGGNADTDGLTPEQITQITTAALQRSPGRDLAGVVAVLVPFGFFAMCVLVVWMGLRRKQNLIRAQAEIRKQVLDKFSTGAELSAFLESPSGRQFLNEMHAFDTGGFMRAGSRTLTWGLITTFLGLAFLVLTIFANRHDQVAALLLLAIGGALLVSFALSRRLAGNAVPPAIASSGPRPGSGPFPGAGGAPGASSSGPILPA